MIFDRGAAFSDDAGDLLRARLEPTDGS